MYWSWEVALDVLPQLSKGVVVTVQATIVASLLAYVLGLAIAILKMSKSKLLRVVLYWITEFIRRTPILEWHDSSSVARAESMLLLMKFILEFIKFLIT